LLSVRLLLALFSDAQVVPRGIFAHQQKAPASVVSRDAFQRRPWRSFFTKKMPRRSGALWLLLVQLPTALLSAATGLLRLLTRIVLLTALLAALVGVLGLLLVVLVLIAHLKSFQALIKLLSASGALSSD
jgi:hypothetical protein